MQPSRMTAKLVGWVRRVKVARLALTKREASLKRIHHSRGARDVALDHILRSGLYFAGASQA